jgi:hypothetical protein
MRIRPPAARHFAWTGLLIAMLLLPAWNEWGPKVAAPVLPPARPGQAQDWSASANARTPAVVRNGEAVSLAGRPLARRAQPSGHDWKWTWEWVALACYLAGCGTMLGRLIAGTVQARLLVRRATLDDGYLVSVRCAAPVTMGWFRPVVVLPEGWRRWPAAELDAVLTHEAEHVRRHDPLVQWLALLNRCLFWFHPLAWWLERKLSELSEEACDVAVLRRGHDPHDYSEYLIDLARSVDRAGSRVMVCGAAMSGSLLSTRIRRLMDGNPVPELSRTRACGLAALCALTVAVFAACRPERAAKLAPGQPTMNELERRMVERNKEQNQKRERMLDEVHKLTLEQAQALEMQVKADPQDPDKILKLVRYYQYKVDVKDLDALTLWFIEHRPEQPWAWNINREWDHDGFARGKRLWLAHLNRPGVTKETYERAAAFLEGGDKPMAEQILLEGQKAYPGEDWALHLGSHYAQVLLGSVGPVAEYNVLRTLSMKEAHGPYAQSVRAKLAASNDPHLLMQTAQWVFGRGIHFLYRKDNPLDFDIVALARSYNDRALSIQPDYASAQQVRVQLDRFDQSRRIEQLANMPAGSRKDVSASDLMLLRAEEMNRAWRQYKVDDANAKARELLRLAVSNPSNSEYGDVAFDANIMLGKVALRRGDKRASARYLLAATETPGSEKIRLGRIMMDLPRALLDWGERDAVAQFLERMAPKTIRSGELRDWAEQIRKGINPDLRPMFTGCSQAPC